MAETVLTNTGLLSVIAEFKHIRTLAHVSKAVAEATRPLVKMKLGAKATTKYMRDLDFRGRVNLRVERPWTQLTFTLVGKWSQKKAKFFRNAESLNIHILRDLSLLKNFENIRQLTLLSSGKWDQPWSDLKISDFPLLEHITVESSTRSLSGIRNLPMLKSLRLYQPFKPDFYSDLSDLSPLIAFTKLEVFEAPDHSISTLEPLAKLPNLKELRIPNFHMGYLHDASYYAPLGQCKNLEVLDLSLDYFDVDSDDDVAPRLGFLRNLKKLTYLDVSEFPDADLADVRDLEIEKWRH